MSASFFLGVDGGQSSTTALIGDASGRVLGRGSGGPCNHVTGPEARDRFRNAIGSCVGAACRSAGLDPSTISFESCCFGFSGGAADKETLTRELISGRRFLITNDARIALAGALNGGAGIIVIAGTGSIALGKSQDGRFQRAGGWGYVIGDEGGAFDLARRALRAALRYEEGWGPETALHRLLLDRTGACDANDLLHRVYTPELPRPAFATLGRLVDEAATLGDAVARAILSEAAQELAALASAIRSHLFTHNGRVPVAPIGGAFRSAFLLRDFQAAIREIPFAEPISASFGPAAGALIEAYAAAGIAVTLSDGDELEK